MLPPTRTALPSACTIRPINVVVVDFPLVPVIAMIGPLTQRDASSSSPMTSTPRRRAGSKSGCSVTTPGLVTIKSAASNVFAVCPPSSSAIPAARSRSASVNVGRASVRVTRAPRRTSSSAAAIPLRAAPTTTTRRPSTLNAPDPTSSPQLQRRQTEQRENHRDDQKPRDHLGLAPADELEVVMNGRHLEHAFAREPERDDLDDHGEPFEHEDSADDREQQFLLDQNGDRAERAAEGE